MSEFRLDQSWSIWSHKHVIPLTVITLGSAHFCIKVLVLIISFFNIFRDYFIWLTNIYRISSPNSTPLYERQVWVKVINDLKQNSSPVDGVGRVEGDAELVEQTMTCTFASHQSLDQLLADVEVAPDPEHRDVDASVTYHLLRIKCWLCYSTIINVITEMLEMLWGWVRLGKVRLG